MFLLNLLLAITAPGARFVQPATAQSYDDIQYKKYEDANGFAFSFPEDWRQDSSPKFSVVITSSSGDAYCTIKRTKDWSFSVMTKSDYVKSAIQNRALLNDMLEMQYKSGTGTILVLSKFPIGMQDGVLLVTKGEMNDQDVTSATYQIVNDGALHTVACFSLSQNAGYYFPIFANIGGSISFSKITE